MRPAAWLLSLVVAAPALAAAQDGEISGRVSDPAGNAVADVRVTISGAAILFARTTSSSPAGFYRFTALPAGTYRVTFEAEGSQAGSPQEVSIGEGTRVMLDAHVEAGRPEDDAPGIVAAGALVAPRAAGGNRFSGKVWSTFTDERLQSTNLSPALAAQGAGSGNPIHRETEVGFEAGGPIWPGRAWLLASADRTDSNVGVIGFYTSACTAADGTPVAGAALRPRCLHSDSSRLDHASVRLQLQWAPEHRSTLAWGRSETRRPTRGSSAYNRLEHTNRQSDLGRAQPFQLLHQAVFSNRTAFDAKYSFSDASFILDFHDPGLSSVQGAYDRYTLVQWRSGVQAEHRRPTVGLAVTGRRVSGGAGARRGETSAGLEFMDRASREITRTGGGAVAVFDSRGGTPAAYQGRVVRDGETSHRERRWSAFFQQSVQERQAVARGGFPLRRAGRLGGAGHDPGEHPVARPPSGGAFRGGGFGRRVPRPVASGRGCLGREPRRPDDCARRLQA